MATATARDRMLSNDFLVLSTIYTLNQLNRRCSTAILIRETRMSPRTVSRSIDRLLDLGMVRCSWSSEGGPDIRVTDDAQGLASDLVRAQHEDPKE